jgi:hypothetical protein
MKLWIWYKTTIYKNFGLEGSRPESIDEWRNLIFTNTILGTLPLSMIAYIPGLIFSLDSFQFAIAVIDTLAVLLVLPPYL